MGCPVVTGKVSSLEPMRKMPRTRSMVVLGLLILLVGETIGTNVVELEMRVTGRATVYAGSSNNGPLERMFYTMAHVQVDDMLLAVDSGSRWPWIYTAGDKRCTLLKRPEVDIPCPNVPSYNVSNSDAGLQLSQEDVTLHYGAAFFSASQEVSTEGGYYTDSLSFTAMNGSAVPVTLNSFIGINEVALNTPVLEMLQSGIAGVGAPCFLANDTDVPCDPFFLGQLSDALGASEVISYDLDGSDITLGRGSLVVGEAATGTVWQPLADAAYDQGLWYIELEFAVNSDSEFSNCIALVDTGGGPTSLPTSSAWTFGRDCSGVDELPSYFLKLPDTGDVMEFTPDDYIIRYFDEETGGYVCESSVFFASSVAENIAKNASHDYHHGEAYPNDLDPTGFCVIGMWTAVTFPLSFRWQAGAEAVGFSIFS